MRVFTNTYFPLHIYKNIYNTLKQPQSILKFENKVYVSLIINQISNKNIIIKNKFNLFILDSIENYKTKFMYVNDDFYDLIDEKDIKLYKIERHYIKIYKNLEKNDILLIEDKNKFQGVV
jgi:hypothetical protein